MLCPLRTKQHVLNRAVSKCPSISMEILGQKIPSLLDSGSMVMLIHEGHFKKHVLPLLNKTNGDLTEAHSLFQLSAANNEVMPVSKYFEADVMLLGFKVPNVGFLVVKDPNTLLEPQHNTQLIGCNRVQPDSVWDVRSLAGFMGWKPSGNLIVLKVFTL